MTVTSGRQNALGRERKMRFEETHVRAIAPHTKLLRAKPIIIRERREEINAWASRLNKIKYPAGGGVRNFISRDSAIKGNC